MLDKNKLKESLLLPAGFILISILVFFFFLSVFKNYTGFTGAVDECTLVFCDFQSCYYPMGQKILSDKFPVPGFYYSPFFAVILRLWGMFDYGPALFLWGVFQVFSFILLLLVSGVLTKSGKPYSILLLFFLSLISFPILHNFSWGQISVFITLLIIVSLYFYSSNRVIPAAFFLAAAFSIKFYPLAFIVYFIFKKDFRFVIYFSIFSLAMLFLLPALFIGAGQTIGFYFELSGRLAGFGGYIFGNNTQTFTNIVYRFFSTTPNDQHAIIDLLIAIPRYIVIASSLVLVYYLSRRKHEKAIFYAFGIIFTLFPFVVSPSWPHYFTFLPFIQVYLLIALMEENTLFAKLQIFILLLPSMICPTILLFSIFRTWQNYNFWGPMFFPCLFLLIILCIRVIRMFMEDGREKIDSFISKLKTIRIFGK